jgi:hypothetical protein
MNHASSSHSLARVLAAPWQQRRNGGLWGLILIVALCAAAPIGLSLWSLVCDPSQVDAVLGGARRSAWVGAGALLVAGWAILIGNVLQQNHPTLARLVPGHVGSLRAALLVTWAILVFVAAGGPGFLFDAPLAWACGAAGALVLFAAVLRWPLLFLPCIAAPFATAWFLEWNGRDALATALQAQWESADWLVTAIVATAGVVVLTLMIRTGGTSHAGSFEARRRFGRAWSAGLPGGASAASAVCWSPFGKITVRPYAAWMRHLLARGDSPVMSRLLLGLGPATHWTSRVFESFWFLSVSGGLCLLMAGIVGGRMRVYMLPWIAFTVLTGLCTPALKAVPKLYHTRREQALLMLLPGVPRGARLNRWLAWQMTGVFLVAALCGLAMAWALSALADSIQPGIAERATGGMTTAIAVALLPQVAWQWRHWARLRGAGGSGQSVPVLAPFVVGMAVLTLHAVTGIAWSTFAVALAAASLVYCAWRWWRMGSEPSALPVGRLG